MVAFNKILLFLILYRYFRVCNFYYNLVCLESANTNNNICMGVVFFISTSLDYERFHRNSKDFKESFILEQVNLHCYYILLKFVHYLCKEIETRALTGENNL